MSNKERPKGRGRTDIEIDRRVFNGHTVVLLEDRSMMQRDGTSYQYIIAIESVSDKGNTSLSHKRYITGLMKKKGYANAYEGARAVFLDPDSAVGVLGEHWTGYQAREGLREAVY